MNWLESKLNEYNITRYRLSKETGISEQYLKKIIDNDISLMDLKLPAKAIIAIIQRGHNVIIPKGMTKLRPNDLLLVFTLEENSEKNIEFFRG